MRRDFVIVGTGGQGRECLDIALAMIDEGCDLNPVGFVDDCPSPENKEMVEKRGYPIIGTLEAFLRSPGQIEVCIGIGSGGSRAQVDQRLRDEGVSCPVLRHPSCTVGSGVVLGAGSVIWAGARLTTNILTGRHVHLNQNVTIGHDSQLANYVTVNPLAAVSGHVRVGSGATVGAGAVILQNLTVGALAVVGAGGVVVRSVEQGAVVKGVPAR